MTPRKRIPRLGRWPVNAAAVWKLTAAHYRLVKKTNAAVIDALHTRLQARDKRVVALEEDNGRLALQNRQLRDQIGEYRHRVGGSLVEARALLQSWLWVTEAMGKNLINNDDVEEGIRRVYEEVKEQL